MAEVDIVARCCWHQADHVWCTCWVWDCCQWRQYSQRKNLWRWLLTQVMRIRMCLWLGMLLSSQHVSMDQRMTSSTWCPLSIFACRFSSLHLCNHCNSHSLETLHLRGVRHPLTWSQAYPQAKMPQLFHGKCQVENLIHWCRVNVLAQHGWFQRQNLWLASQEARNANQMRKTKRTNRLLRM